MQELAVLSFRERKIRGEVSFSYTILVHITIYSPKGQNKTPHNMGTVLSLSSESVSLLNPFKCDSSEKHKIHRHICVQKSHARFLSYK